MNLESGVKIIPATTVNCALGSSSVVRLISNVIGPRIAEIGPYWEESFSFGGKVE